MLEHSTIDRRKISVVVPAYNEEDVIGEFHRRLSSVLDALPEISEVIYVNDGSTDRTSDLLKLLHQNDSRVTILDLSRNYGKEIALTAGLDSVNDGAAIVIDADLQDPPELMPRLISLWHDGYDVVYATRAARDGDSVVKRLTARLFYSVMQRLSRVDIPQNTGDYRLLSARAVEALKSIRERHRFMKGLFAWIGFPQTSVMYRRDPRFAGKTKWNYWKLWNLALEGITSFSTVPLRIASYLGVLTALTAFLYATTIIYKTIRYGDPVAGYPSLMVVILFLGGVQLMTLGVIGEYLGRTYNESKQRPLYIVKEYLQSGPPHVRASDTPT